ncbi:hypothetical protein [Vibrio mexicanus]|uniref:hypothetical protein n=1 Tax=Vibrio mexicanus TaxID=1004326 RepID=UPI00063BFB0B|nr:hypothetical protein [Vibrio mexicanus]
MKKQHALLIAATSLLLWGCSNTETAEQYECQFYDDSEAPQWYCNETIAGYNGIHFVKIALEEKEDLPRAAQERLLLEHARLRFNQQANSEAFEKRELDELIIEHPYGTETSSSAHFQSTVTSESTLSQVKIYRVAFDSEGTMYGLAGMPKKAL